MLSLPISVGLNSLCVASVFVMTIVKWVSTPVDHKVRDHITLLSPILVFVALAISLFYTADLSLGLDMVFRKNAYILLPITVFVNQELFRSRITDYFAAYLFGLTIAGVLTLILFCLPQEQLVTFLDGKDWLREYAESPNRLAFGIYSPFMDRLQFGYLLGIGGILHIWYLLRGQLRLIGLLSSIIVGVTLVIIGARGAQLAFVISTFFICCYWFVWESRLSKLRKMLVGTGTVLGFLVLPWLLFRYVPAVTQRYGQLMWEMDIYLYRDITQYDYTHFTSVRRIFSWTNTWELIQQHWILGVGIGDVVAELEQVYLSNNLMIQPNSHNQLMLYWVSAGLLGLFTGLFMIGSYLRLIWQRQTGTIRMIALSYIVYYLVIFLFDVPIWYSVGINGFFSFFCLFLISDELLSESNQSR